MTTRAIDAWVNTRMWDGPPPEYLQRVAQDYFKRPEEMFREVSCEELVATMDAHGVETAVLTVVATASPTTSEVFSYLERFPDRFVLSAHVDPRSGMEGLRALEALARNEALVLARATPFMVELPPDDRVYYPLYSKCIELDLPISVNTGIPGPPVPGRCQHPMHLEPVCDFFPELELIMAHGADPWWEVAIALMRRHARLHLMTSAYAPRYLPPVLLDFMRTDGADRVIFASDHPVLAIDRCVREARALDLPEEVRAAYLHGNAARLLLRRERELTPR